MSVIDSHGHFSLVSCLVGYNNGLFAISRRKSKFPVREGNSCSVHGDAVNILFINRNRLRFTIGLAVYNAGNQRINIIQNNAVGIDIAGVTGAIGQLCVDHIFVIRFNVKRTRVCSKYAGVQFVNGKFLVA